MTEEERYLFDLQGYLVVENAITPESLAAMNAWLDAQDITQAQDSPLLRHYGSLLAWGPEFRALLDNPRVLPYLVELMGDDLRLDHDYPIFSNTGGKDLHLHGGGTPYDPAQYYHSFHGRLYSGLTVASYALTPIPPGAGGFACIPGSHKSNFRLPDDIRHFRRPSPIVRQVPVNAGDCVLFTEALTHGTFPWTAAHQRRNLFLKYSPKHMTWGSRVYFPNETRHGMEALEAELTPAQRVLLDPPAVAGHRHLPSEPG